MTKKIFLCVVLTLLATFILAPTSLACTSEACMATSHPPQDTLILGKVVSVRENTSNVKILHIFPQNRMWFIWNGKVITVQEKMRGTYVGGTYLMSLSYQGNNMYGHAWGLYEVTGTTYKNATLVEKRTDPFLQELITSDGTKNPNSGENKSKIGLIISNHLQSLFFWR